MVGQGFFATGWVRFGPDPVVKDWVAHARPAALEALTAVENAHWWRCGGTWFAGVNVLANDAAGRIGGGPPLGGAAVDFVADALGLSLPLDPGQLSVTRPGYPQPSEDESAAAARYRRDRDAAHVDGLLPIGPDRRRMIREPHGFILGLPVTESSADAAPLVVWEGSHQIMRRAFAAALHGHPPEDWPDIDVTEAYHAARREVFATCRRVAIPARPGEATVIHRLALHGVASWAEGATADPAGRAIVYFRPELPGGIADWLAAP
ncbi:MAG: hypothetical protein GC186_09315 [Rhodobacteraceae bacterium]|nr:hypothetical protein [Paracoccaceae bacterium]